MTPSKWLLTCGLVVGLGHAPLFASPLEEESGSILRVLLLGDFNTRIVVMGTVLLGMVSGLAGTFLLLRKRALMSDVLTHGMFPGVVVAFLLTAAIMGGKSQPVLLMGGAVTASIALLGVLFLRRARGLADDSAMAIVLGSSFGLGVVLLGVALDAPGGNQAGLEHYIYGKAASMTRGDLLGIALVAAVVMVVIIALFKELRLLCFDTSFASSIGRPVGLFDGVLLAAVVATTLIGLQAVGLILVIALLVIPPTTARFWTDDLKLTTVIAMGIGGVGCYLGVIASALVPQMPAGALIVLATAALFLVGLFFGPRRGVLNRLHRMHRLRRIVGRDHLLRAVFELSDGEGDEGSGFSELLGHRSWGSKRLRHLLRKAVAGGEIVRTAEGHWRLTDRGEAEARAIVRNHRLWERYLLRYAHLAVSHVDRAADRIEHVLEPELIRRLEADLDSEGLVELPSPHPLPGTEGGEP
ncbi:MAG: metal ABC transporter permease [Phycisphaerales bacterium]|nr:metal ABC transporter permease [Phycisphaerales bacterium]